MLSFPRRFVSRFVLPLVAGGFLFGAATARADEWCTLSLKDGRTVSGILVDSNDAQVTIRPDDGVNTAFAREEIVGVKLEKSSRESYLAARASLKPDDLGSRYELLLNFYYKNEKSLVLAQLAKAEADQLAQDFPDSAQVKRLVRIITDRLAQKDGAAPQGPATDPVKAPTPEPAPEVKSADKPKNKADDKAGDKAGDKDEERLPSAPVVGLLSAADQNLLRVYQLNYKVSRGGISGPDRAVKVVFAKGVLEEMFKNHADADELARYKGKPGLAQFANLPPLAQLDVLFAVRDRALYPKVEVKTEPATLAAFRTQYHRHVVAHFSGYFAGLVPGLIAKPKAPSTQPEAYTNFLALNLAVVDGHPVINRDKPEESLLLQWGLPRNEAKFRAPNIKGWKPCFSSPRDSRFLALVEWINTTSATEGFALPAPSAAAPAKP